MSIFTRKKPVEEKQQMTSFTPMPDYNKPVEKESVIGGIQRVVDNMPDMIYNPEPQAAPIQQPRQAVAQPKMQPQQIDVSNQDIINAINELEERLSFVERIIRRVI